MFLHVIRASDMANQYHGTYKDVISRVDWLKKRFPDYKQVLVNRDDTEPLRKALAGCTALTGALVEYSYHPQIVKYLKRHFPSALVAVRAINIEPLQHLDNYGWWPAKGPLWMAYGMARLAAMDATCKRWADHILCINDYEIDAYWRFIPGKAKVAWLPYLCPPQLIPAHPSPYRERRIIACMPTSQKNRKSLDLVMRFIAFASKMKQSGVDYDFVITGDLSSWALPDTNGVRFTGMVDDLSVFLGNCRAVCLLSPLGYGFKTTMGDALAAGAHVVAHADLIERSPAVLRSHLLDAASPSLIRDLDETPSANSLHEELQAINHGKIADVWVSP